MLKKNYSLLEYFNFDQNKTMGLKEELKILDEQVSKKRDILPTIKSERDKLRAKNLLLRQQNGLLGNDKLIIDYGNNMVGNCLQRMKQKI
jgi:hypothetical protein